MSVAGIDIVASVVVPQVIEFHIDSFQREFHARKSFGGLTDERVLVCCCAQPGDEVFHPPMLSRPAEVGQ